MAGFSVVLGFFREGRIETDRLICFVFVIRERHQCVGICEKETSYVCKKTWKNTRSSENDERCKSK